MTDNHLLYGGKPFYGFDIGIILMENYCARPIGDIGNAKTWPFPVLFEMAEGAAIDTVVEHAAEGLLPSFIEAAKNLESKGVRAIAASCGFVGIFQHEIAAAVSVPVATSSLLQLSTALNVVGARRRVCVITVNSETLTDQHLYSTGLVRGARDRVEIVGINPSGQLYQALIKGAAVLDTDAAREEIVTVAERAVREDPSIGAFVLECTNLPPYTAAIQAATGRPVWDAVTLVRSLQLAVFRPPAL